MVHVMLLFPDVHRQPPLERPDSRPNHHESVPAEGAAAVGRPGASGLQGARREMHGL